MIAIDANVVVRLLVDDDHGQFRRARRLLAASPVFVANTVLLECEWVLRSVYDYRASDFVESAARLRRPCHGDVGRPGTGRDRAELA